MTSKNRHTAASPRVLFLGVNGVFSRVVLEALIAAGVPLVGLVTPRPDRQHAPRWVSFPPVGRSLFQLAAQHELPILEIGALAHPAARPALRSLNPDVIVTACFPRLLPASWLALPRLGCLNLHPSLLPAYRGPYPLFWQFRAGETRTGVTLHFMDAGADTGDIAAQAEVPFPDGITGPEADTLTAQAGARLLIQALRSPENIPRRPQPAENASYHPRPTPRDLEIPTTWRARRAFNFIRGANEWRPFRLQLPGSREAAAVWEALEYAEGVELGAACQREGDTLRVQFADGVVRVRSG